MLKHYKSYTHSWTESKMRKSDKGNSLRSLKMCKKCYTFYYKNSWVYDKPKQQNSWDDEPTISICFTECPACLSEESSKSELESSFA